MVRTRQQTTAAAPVNNAENSHASHHVKRQALENTFHSTEQPAKKRAALGDLTNATQRLGIDSTKKSLKQLPIPLVNKDNEEKTQRRSRKLNDLAPIAQINESELVVSSSEPTSPMPTGNAKRRSNRISAKCLAKGSSEQALKEDDSMEIDSAVDFDTECFYDISNCSIYARDIFRYYRTRETKFQCGDYLKKCTDFNSSMRATLVDWMVEIQEQFELNHETLYQAVKMVDIYISKHLNIDKNEVQLIGSVALFASSKFDERQPPLADDFLYVCDDAYTREEFMEMERRMLIALDFDIGMPISYRFVRRYSKVTKADTELLTLARFILEASLMFYEFSLTSDSLLAASALALALHMRAKRPLKLGNDEAQIWTRTHVSHSEYDYQELVPTIQRLNTMLLNDITKYVPQQDLTTVFTKYSHEIFHSVAKKFKPLED